MRNIFLIWKYISPKNKDDHHYEKPIDDIIKGTYERLTCTALNILANHGYTNRNGKNIDRSSVVDGLYKVFGVEK